MKKRRVKKFNQAAADVIDAFGSLSAAARAVGAPVATVFGWQQNGIPEWRWPQISHAAAALKIKLPPSSRAA